MKLVIKLEGGAKPFICRVDEDEKLVDLAGEMVGAQGFVICDDDHGPRFQETVIGPYGKGSCEEGYAKLIFTVDPKNIPSGCTSGYAKLIFPVDVPKTVRRCMTLKEVNKFAIYEFDKIGAVIPSRVRWATPWTAVAKEADGINVA